MRKVWIEAALNGGWGRPLQPGIPDTVDAIVADGIACARAGATIIHTHAYDDSGQQTYEWQVYARIIARGGHIRVGLEDAPLGSPSSNLALVEEAVRMVRDQGAEVASVAEMRQMLAALPRP
jgi:uncharacterized protein (DUF849 family)